MLLKDYIVQQVTAIILNDYQEGLITEDEAQMLAGIVVRNIETVKTEEDVLKLIKMLNAKYDAFENLETSLEGALERKKELHVANKVLHLIKQGSAKKAVDLARQHTE